MTNDAAFPVFGYNHLGQPVPIAHGLTKHEYACISLKVPRTGIAEVDSVIREALRCEDARAAMQGMISKAPYKGGCSHENPKDYAFAGEQQKNIVVGACQYADAMAQAGEAK